MLEANATTKTINLKYLVKFIAILITIVIISFVCYGVKLGIFQDKMVLIRYMKRFGIYAPIIFILFQILQVIFPFIPGGVSCLAGVLAFGPLLGFVYNYIGLILGSCIAYFLAQKYGLQLIENLFKKETVDKYLTYIQNRYFSKIFLVGIFLPGLPDDLLCYIAGISNMKFKTFFVIIILGKPIALITYSLFVNLL